MKILVFGNVGSGKTTVLRKLQETFPFDVIAIDDFRRKFGDGSKELEAIAKEKFLERITENKNQFIECVGVGRLADELYELLYATQEVVICLTLHAPKNICETRLSNRIWDIPFPEPIEKVSSLIERTEKKIEANEISIKWSNRKNTSLISKRNIQLSDIDLITSELVSLIEQTQLATQDMTDIEVMLSKSIQDYYGNEYLTYQKNVIERNDKFLADKSMISKFIAEIAISGNVVDIGAGDCQWFSLFENIVSNYYAIETNKIALSLAPKSEKLIKLNENIFDDRFCLTDAIPHKLDFALFSFFISHYFDASIHTLLNKMKGINSIIIVDSLWSSLQKEKYRTKELEEVKRKITPTDSISLPKRFFEYSDIYSLVKPHGYTITRFIEGNYWFACCVNK